MVFSTFPLTDKAIDKVLRMRPYLIPRGHADNFRRHHIINQLDFS